MTEIWKDIAGWEEFYQVSNLGRVKRMANIVIKKNGHSYRCKSHILKPKIESNGYVRLHLAKTDKTKFLLLHRLVAEAFIDNPENKPQINHKDGDKANNSISNLEWCTGSENMIHAYKVIGIPAPKAMLGRKGKLHPNSKPIICTTTNQYFESMNLAAIFFNLRPTAICRVAKGERPHTHGLKFKYA